MGQLVQPPAEAGSPTADCRGPCPGGSWISPEKETPQPPRAAIWDKTAGKSVDCEDALIPPAGYSRGRAVTSHAVTQWCFANFIFFPRELKCCECLWNRATPGRMLPAAELGLTGSSHCYKQPGRKLTCSFGVSSVQGAQSCSETWCLAIPCGPKAKHFQAHQLHWSDIIPFY